MSGRFLTRRQYSAWLRHGERVVRVSDAPTPYSEPLMSLTGQKKRYQKTQTIHGLSAPAGLSQCQQLPKPIYTPSTKAELGDKDINISPDEADRGRQIRLPHRGAGTCLLPGGCRIRGRARHNHCKVPRHLSAIPLLCLAFRTQGLREGYYIVLAGSGSS